MHYRWTIMEDECIEAWSEFVFLKTPKHFSLHFDGIRVDKKTAGDPEMFAKESMEYIKNKTGYNVEIVQKKHYYFIELIQQRNKGCKQLTSLGFPNGYNCIPSSMSRLLPLKFAEIKAKVDNSAAENIASKLRGARKYQSWDSLVGYDLLPKDGLCVDSGDMFLIHCEQSGVPHCIGLRRDGTAWLAYDLDKEYKLTEEQLRCAYLQSMDKKCMVTFCVTSKGLEMELNQNQNYLSSWQVLVKTRLKNMTVPKSSTCL